MGDCSFKCRSEGSRPWLYVMIVVIMLTSCSTDDRTEKMEKQISDMQRSIDDLKAQAHPSPSKP